MSRIYLGRRDVRDATAAQAAAFEAISEWRQTEIRNALGQRFRASVRVGLRRPWWLPRRLYHALLASVVTEDRLERKR